METYKTLKLAAENPGSGSTLPSVSPGVRAQQSFPLKKERKLVYHVFAKPASVTMETYKTLKFAAENPGSGSTLPSVSPGVITGSGCVWTTGPWLLLERIRDFRTGIWKHPHRVR